MLLVSFLSAFFLFFYENSVFVQVDLNSFFVMPFCVSLIFDKQSLVFVSTVGGVSSLIFVYSYVYLSGSEDRYSMKKFLLILMLFVVSMFVLSLSGNMFWMMIGWDGLGISSFCLIIFYQNWKSFSSGMVTFMSNRLGDVFIVICLLWCCMGQSSASWMMAELFFLSALFGVGCYSKSAQFPYLFWLPQAMAAPTPVSALVHSSTLVTAGVFSVCRYNMLLDSGVGSMLFFISCVTVILAGASSLYEFDLKKIIALSTLCHVSLMMMFSVKGDVGASLFHFMMHAYFKSLLFMIAGYLIHQNFNSQDIRYIAESGANGAVSVPFFVATFSMMGFPFMSGFYSKELMLVSSSYQLSSALMFLVFMLNSFFSCAYSIRMGVNIFMNSGKKIFLFGFDLFYYVFLLGSIFSTVMGGLSAFFLMGLEEELVMSPLFTAVLLFFSLGGVLVGSGVDLFYLFKGGLVGSWGKLWFSDYLYKVYQKHFFLGSFLILWSSDEKGSLKNFQVGLLKKLLSVSVILNSKLFNSPLSILKVFHLLMFGVVYFSVYPQ